MTERAFDLELPGGFVRAKRTLLLFSAALFVLAFTTPDLAGDELTLTFIKANIDRSILVWLLVGGGLYYAVALWLEARAVPRLNSEMVKQSSLTSYDQAIGRVAADLGTVTFLLGANNPRPLAEALDESRKALDDIVADPPPDVDVVAQHVVKAFIAMDPNNQVAHLPELSMAVHRAFGHRTLATETSAAVKKLDASMADMVERVGRMNGALVDLDSKLTQQREWMTRFARSIRGERALGFWILDVGAAYAFLVVSLALSWARATGRLLL